MVQKHTVEAKRLAHLEILAAESFDRHHVEVSKIRKTKSHHLAL
jgi:hypothetical protein